MNQDNNKIYKYNVVTLGSRDYYQVPMSLLERGIMGYLITDFYAKWPFSLVTSKRQSDSLKGINTISFYPFFLLAKLLSKCPKLNSFRRVVVDYSFGFLSAFFTWLTYDRAVVYSYYLEGFVAFYKFIGRRPKHLVCFQVHPTPWFINKVIQSDTDICKSMSFPTFLDDLDATYTQSQINEYISALSFCDSVICASSFTERSILEGTGLNVKTKIVPYGSKLGSCNTGKHTLAEKIRLVTVCQLTQRKGMHWAFQAMKESGCLDKYEWVIVANKIDKAIVDMAPINVRFVSHLSDQELSTLFNNSDLFIMPSIVEGFGLVYIEALSKGLPIVYTENTGPNDFCLDGVHGFKVECSSIDSIKFLFQTLADNPYVLENMKPACTTLAANINWSNFRNIVGDFVKSGITQHK